MQNENVSNKLKERSLSVLDKIIQDTEAVKLEWDTFEIITLTRNKDYGSICTPLIDDCPSKFVSKFHRKIGKNSKGYECYIKKDITMVIVKLPCSLSSNEMCYEAYFVKDGEEFTFGTSHDGARKLNEEFDKLNQLWNVIEYYIKRGKKEYEFNKLLDEILE